MLTFAGGPSAPALRLLVVHDDAEREFEYIAGAEKVLDAAQTHGWTAVSMKRDWRKVFPVDWPARSAIAQRSGPLMISVDVEKKLRRLTTPRAAAVVGILFSLLFSTSLVSLRSAIPEDPARGDALVGTPCQPDRHRLRLMPFAGIAFIWFIGVMRDRMGEYEDRFFSAVFYGSGLLFLGMVFVWTAIAGGILATARFIEDATLQSQALYFGRVVMFQISTIYALRIAGVFMISLGTIWWRTGLMPRWLALITYLLAVTLLLVISRSLWITLIFPAWVAIIDVYALPRIARRRLNQRDDERSHTCSNLGPRRRT